MARLGRRTRTARGDIWLAAVVGGIAVIGHLTTAVQILIARYLFHFASGDPTLPLVELPQLIQADVRSGHTYTVSDLSPAVRLLSAAPSLAAAGTIAVAVFLLARILRRIAARQAFDRPTRRQIALLSTVLIGGSLLQGVLDIAAIAVIVASVDQAAVQGIGTYPPNWPWTLIVVGVAVSALGAAFAEGARLQEDVAGVV